MYIYDNDNNLLAIVIKNGTSTKDKDFHTDHSSELQIASFNLKKDELSLTNNIEEKEHKNSLLSTNLDLDYIETLIRERFLFGKKDETIYIIKKNDN